MVNLPTINSLDFNPNQINKSEILNNFNLKNNNNKNYHQKFIRNTSKDKIMNEIKTYHNIGPK